MQCPPIRYATTSDGVKIAYWTLGSGPPTVWWEAPGCSHLRGEWDLDDIRGNYQRAAQFGTVIRFDPRGAGLSGRSPGRYTLDHFLLDALAVANALGIDRFGVQSQMTASLLCIALAAKHPERVRHVVAFNTFSSTAKWLDSPVVRALKLMKEAGSSSWVDVEWFAFAGQIGRTPKTAAIMEKLIREADPEALEAIQEFDVSPLLSSVSRPTVILKIDDQRIVEEYLCREVAASVPSAMYLKSTWADAPALLQGLRSQAGGTPQPPRTAAEVGAISTRETEVLKLIGKGRTNQQIADELSISANTVAKHVASILAKTGAANRTEAATFVKGLR